MKGSVKWFNDAKGYGFITIDSEREVFVHKSDLVGVTTLSEGQSVEFEIGEDQRGREKAVQVRRVG